MKSSFVVSLVVGFVLIGSTAFATPPSATTSGFPTANQCRAALNVFERSLPTVAADNRTTLFPDAIRDEIADIGRACEHDRTAAYTAYQRLAATCHNRATGHGGRRTPPVRRDPVCVGGTQGGARLVNHACVCDPINYGTRQLVCIYSRVLHTLQCYCLMETVVFPTTPPTVTHQVTQQTIRVTESLFTQDEHDRVMNVVRGLEQLCGSAANFAQHPEQCIAREQTVRSNMARLQQEISGLGDYAHEIGQAVREWQRVADMVLSHIRRAFQFGASIEGFGIFRTTPQGASGNQNTFGMQLSLTGGVRFSDTIGMSARVAFPYADHGVAGVGGVFGIGASLGLDVYIPGVSGLPFIISPELAYRHFAVMSEVEEIRGGRLLGTFRGSFMGGGLRAQMYLTPILALTAAFEVGATADVAQTANGRWTNADAIGFGTFLGIQVTGPGMLSMRQEATEEPNPRSWNDFYLRREEGNAAFPASNIVEPAPAAGTPAATPAPAAPAAPATN